jgi:hypothetical protein
MASTITTPRSNSVRDLQLMTDQINKILIDIQGKIGKVSSSSTASPGVFTSSFESIQQTITVGGRLIIPHSMGVSPKLVQAWLVCKTSSVGYTPGQMIPAALWEQSSTLADGFGMAIDVSDGINIKVQFGSSDSFYINNWSTGVLSSAIAANWNVIFRAWG